MTFNLYNYNFFHLLPTEKAQIWDVWNKTSWQL